MPRQNTSPADYPQAVLQQIQQLAQNIVIARKRRGETQAQWAKKLGVSQPTIARIERGDPAVAMASYVMCMWMINPANGLADLISPLSDRAALEREVTKASKKRRAAVSSSTAEVASMPPVPATDRWSSLEDSKKLSDLGRMSDPLADVRKVLERATEKNNPTANGLASLLLKTQT